MRALAIVALLGGVAHAGPPTAADEIALATKLAAVLDSGAPLGPLADPVEGVHVWWVPGAEEIEQTQLHAGDQPSARFATTNMTPWMQQHYGSEAATDLRYALAHLDVEPKHPDAAAYRIDCTRTTDVRAPRATLVGLALDRSGGVKITFVVRAGKLYVSSIHVRTPCEV
jgi:hypothetical protein